MQPTRRQKWLLALAGIQLLLVAWGASDIGPMENKVGDVLEYYGTLSGANSGYGFFAPGVGSQLRGRFDVYGPGGTKTEHALESGVNREADLRVGNILGWFWNDPDNRPLQRSFAASWAGKIYARYPEAEKVGVRLETYVLPTMEGYRKGERPYWKAYYEAKFVRNKKPEADRGATPAG